MIFSWLANAPTLIKIAVFFGVWMGLWMPIAVVSAFALNWRPSEPLNETQKLTLLASLYGIAPIVLWKVSQVEGRSFFDYGLAWRSQFFRSIAIGFGLAVISLIALFGFQFILGWLNWRQQHWENIGEQSSSLNFGRHPIKGWIKIWEKILVFGPILLIALWISSTEELIFRGFLQKQLQQEYSAFIAAVLASGIFALTHLFWDVRNTLRQLPGLGLMGMVLTFACLGQGGSLGLAIGLHAGWIWGIASLDTLGGVDPTQKVPEWVTGLGGKPLAGMLGIVMLLVVAGLLEIVYPLS
ncbi:CPBP family intramembrane glutamic endopeptidase [Planktothrix mougeotii]|uniref:CPBP family intramembrane metalloprotease n=1 Tax=Planktothrix mougeotii LEGE 06226 TaxID=1828728 RepID=A0ABR9UA76_9CYAN|nr:type II CAAX endopeptidase family protein [Planktothrix mougeotii]MBE9142529.1 CPBP family intramembrane metalloprotease [Planktothrix mougeotii LEGE 06226]